MSKKNNHPPAPTPIHPPEMLAKRHRPDMGHVIGAATAALFIGLTVGIVTQPDPPAPVVEVVEVQTSSASITRNFDSLKDATGIGKAIGGDKATPYIGGPK